MNILTFDIEDWWVYEQYSVGRKEDYLPRLDRYLSLVLDLLDSRNIKATFFCLGAVAAKYPDVIRKIAGKKHHLGCHSFSHKFWGDATSEEVADDTRKALDTIEQITGEKVTAYRAPAFSINGSNRWIFEILAGNGIKYDSSIFPANRSFGGFANFNHIIPSILSYNGVTIKEFPISTTTILGKRVAFSGGGYFRMIPYWKIKGIARKSDYMMTYFHLYNFDKEQERHYRSFESESAIGRYIKNYYGLDGAYSKFIKFISDFNFVSVDQAAEMTDWSKAPIVNI